MKRLLIVLTALVFMTCEKEAKVDYAILTGKIENSNVQKATLNAGDYEAEIELNGEGIFSDTLRIPENGFYTMTIGREFTPIYLRKGDSVNLSMDARKFDESIIYTGNGAAENNYLAQKTRDNQTVMANSMEFYTMDESAFKTKTAEIKSNNETALDALKETDSDFLVSEKRNLVFDEYALLQSYENGHAYYAKKEGFKVSSEFLPEELKNMVYDDANAYRNSQSYKQMALQATMDPMFESIGNDISSISAQDLAAIENIKIPALKNDVVNYLGGFLISPGNENMKEVYDLFIKNTTNDKTKEMLTETYEKNKGLTKGNPSPKFVNYENHKGGTTSLDDLKGKYVYVDVWATWCGPCKQEIPFLKDVEKKFHGQNIEFVSTSIDRAADHEKWENMVNTQDLGGVQLFADNDWTSKFVKDYAINGIPRFILIDPQGNIVSADAPRPSDPKLTAMLESELDSEKDQKLKM